MKKTFINRISVFMLAIFMMCSVLIPVSAAEVENATTAVQENGYNVAPREIAVCKPWSVLKMTITLSPYIGFNKTFVVEADCTGDYPSTGDRLYLQLYDGDGKMVSEAEWYVTINSVAQLKLFLPKSGNYTLVVSSSCDADVAIGAYWQ